MEDLDAIEYIWIKDFIGENWQRFLGFMEDRDGEEAADALMEKLEQKGQQ